MTTNEILSLWNSIGSNRGYTADEMTENFAGYGFGKVFDKSDAYAQIVCFERI